MTLGEKIKQARKEKKLTQSELCRDKITRNMLSAIECDKASPSIETLRYIALRLSLPISYLLSDDDDMFFYQKRDVIKGIQDAFRDKRYTACINHISKLSRTDDELSYMLAISHYELGKRAVMSGSLITAAEHLEKAKINCGRTLYDTAKIEKFILLYHALAKNIQSPLLELNVSLFNSLSEDAYEEEFYRYIANDSAYQYRIPVFKKHMEARELMKDRDYYSALKLLAEIIEEKSHDTYNAYVMFGVYTDMEQCSKQLMNFEGAYKYASKRLSMLEGFKT